MLPRRPSALLLLLLSAPMAAAAADTVQVGFRGGVYRGPVQAPLASILELSSRSGSLPQGLAEMQLQLPPGNGALDRNWALAALQARVPGTQFAWFGPEHLARAPEMQHLDGAALVQAAEIALGTVLKTRATEYSLQAVGQPPTPEIAPGDVTFKARLPERLQLHPRMAVAVDAYVGGELARSVTVWFAVHASGPADVYARDMQAGQVPREEDLRREDIDLTSLTSEPVKPDMALDGMWLTRSVKGGQPVLVSDVAPEPMVHNQQRIEVRVVSGRVTIVAWGTAQGTGNQGDVVAVKVDQADGPCDGFVIGRGVVQVEN